jgi:hypothetical protein
VGYGEKYFQELAYSDLRRVVDNLYGFGVACRTATDFFVVGILYCAAGVTGSSARHAFYVLEDGLDAPETASGYYERGLAFLSGESFIQRGIGERGRGAGRTVVEGGEQDQHDAECHCNFCGAIHFLPFDLVAFVLSVRCGEEGLRFWWCLQVRSLSPDDLESKEPHRWQEATPRRTGRLENQQQVQRPRQRRYAALANFIATEFIQ